MKRGGGSGEQLSPEASSLRNAGGGGDGSSIEQPAGAKRARGRPAGSKNKLKPPVIITCGGGGGGGGGESDPGSALRTHVLEIPGGADLSQCLPAFARRRSLCLSVLSASGPISAATIRQPHPSPSLTFRGRFDLISLSASFLLSGGGTMSASLAGPQGQVVGGPLAGPLVAAGKVVVVAALFSDPAFHRLPEDEGEASVSPPSGEEEDGAAARFGGREAGDGGVWAPAPRRPGLN